MVDSLQHKHNKNPKKKLNLKKVGQDLVVESGQGELVRDDTQQCAKNTHFHGATMSTLSLY